MEFETTRSLLDFKDILLDRYGTSDFMWMSQEWQPRVAYQHTLKTTPQKIKCDVLESPRVQHAIAEVKGSCLNSEAFISSFCGSEVIIMTFIYCLCVYVYNHYSMFKFYEVLRWVHTCNVPTYRNAVTLPVTDTIRSFELNFHSVPHGITVSCERYTLGFPVCYGSPSDVFAEEQTVVTCYFARPHLLRL
jgi:hypothetical protein